ncbi:MAG: stage II sporulation protein R [Oscillospiraceae bacterium]|nr:stage II sporulation protein R [Oscillospiraceae bacterium]
MTKQELSVLLGLLFAIVFSVCAQDVKTAQDIRQNTLRLHIIANSDSLQDQSVKIAVRDDILKSENIIFSDAEDFDTAVKNTQKNLGKIESMVNNFLKDIGVGYTARCTLENYHFDTKQYNGFALPKGEYTALTVRLGKAGGKNWWCVVYPALCSQSCGDTVLENSADFIKTEKITARFRVVEIFEDIKYRFAAEKAAEYTN